MKIALLILTMLTGIIGFLFKLQHWPGADLTLNLFFVLFLVFHLMVILQVIREPQVRYGTRIMWLALVISMPFMGSILFISLHSKPSSKQA